MQRRLQLLSKRMLPGLWVGGRCAGTGSIATAAVSTIHAGKDLCASPVDLRQSHCNAISFQQALVLQGQEQQQHSLQKKGLPAGLQAWQAVLQASAANHCTVWQFWQAGRTHSCVLICTASSTWLLCILEHHGQDPAAGQPCRKQPCACLMQ
jgi:hypothetical protein